MSQNTRRSKNVGLPSRSQPSILKTKKRKNSENDSSETSKVTKKEITDMATSSSSRPLGDVTSTSLNVERERAITPDAIPEEWHKFRVITCYPTPQSKRKVPLPNLTWADKEQVWELMCRKDRLFRVNPNYLKKHPALQPRMRAILLDWLTEVCEVYKLHRESYYLATAFIDRYLSLSENVPKQQLQLIGIASLFIASKIEEIYPPKLYEFSYVTDGACLDEEILAKELIILKKLNWDLTPMTCNSWLNTYLQLLHDLIQNEAGNTTTRVNPGPLVEDDSLIFPSYSGLTFVQVARLLDLCTLDFSSLNFSPSKLAATALSFLSNINLACLVSGFSVGDLRECHNWMAPLAIGVQELGPAHLKSFNQVSADDIHNIQTHAVTLEVLEKAHARRNQIEESRCSPPNSLLPSPEVLTPPRTDEKSK